MDLGWFSGLERWASPELARVNQRKEGGEKKTKKTRVELNQFLQVRLAEKVEGQDSS